jgi:excisionase family DNA binding protein
VDDVFLTVDEVATMLRLSASGVRRLCRIGELPAVKIGRVYRLRKADMDAMIAARTAPVALAGGRMFDRSGVPGKEDQAKT